MHLANTHPAASLPSPLGNAQRAQCYKWMLWLSNTMQAMVIHYFYPQRMVARPAVQQAEAAEQLPQPVV